MLGGNAANWRIQHNVLHHSYTNIDEMDEDIAPGKILRMSPYQEKLPIHKYQYISYLRAIYQQEGNQFCPQAINFCPCLNRN